MIWFGSVNDTEASVFGYSGFTCFDRPLEKIHKDSRVKLMKYIHIDCVLFLVLKIWDIPN